MYINPVFDTEFSLFPSVFQYDFYQLKLSHFFQQIILVMGLVWYQQMHLNKLHIIYLKDCQPMLLQPIKDQHTKLQIKLSERSFISGKKLGGAVFINANVDRPYTSLVLKLECIQEYMNKQRGMLSFFGEQKQDCGRQSSLFQRETEVSFQLNMKKDKLKKIINYEQKIVIQEFDEFIPRGQHYFPFQLILPKGLPASLSFENKDIYAKIQYHLTACLLDKANPFKQKSTTQQIHITQHTEKIRYVQKTLYQQNCYCFNFQINNNIRVYYQVNNQFITPGSQLTIVGKIDTRDTSRDVQGVELVLRRKILVREKVRAIVLENKEWVLWDGFRKLNKGLSIPVHITVSVPADIQYPSAEGNFMGVFYEMVMRVDSKNLHGSNEVSTGICVQKLNQVNIEGKRSDSSVGTIKSQKSIKLSPYPETKKISSDIKGKTKQPL